MSPKNRVIIFDTTLRDGLQSSGIRPLTQAQRVQLGVALSDLGVDVIEAGFATASKLDFDTIAALAQKGLDATICSLARATEADITAAAKALKGARSGRIHTFIATSPVHMEHKLRMSPEDVLENAEKAVKLARKLSDDVEFSLEDFTRSNPEFTCKVVEKTIAAGATTINLPDTVGYAMPHEYGQKVREVRQTVTNSDKAVFSTHCHNDLGLAVANSLAGVVEGGARQIECSINGLGERAGNAALEEVAMSLWVRHNLMGLGTGIQRERIGPTSELVSSLTGMELQRNKAVVGANAFAHESGIHQHGMSKNPETYEIMTPASVGRAKSDITLGVTSGRAGLAKKAEELGYTLERAALDRLYPLFLEKAQENRVDDTTFRELLEKVTA